MLAKPPEPPYAARLLQYAVARGTDRGPIGNDFGAVCNQIDQADATLADPRDRIATTPRPRTAIRRDTSRQQPLAMARRDPASRTVSFILDETTANIAIHAITVNAAHYYAQTLPEHSYGRQYRQDIAARETHIAIRPRAVERAYRTALDPDAAPAPELTQVLPADRAPDDELELELELE